MCFHGIIVLENEMVVNYWNRAPRGYWNRAPKLTVKDAGAKGLGPGGSQRVKEGSLRVRK